MMKPHLRTRINNHVISCIILLQSCLAFGQTVKWQDVVPYTATAAVANTYTTTIPSFTFITGREIKIVWATANTGAITLNISGGGAKDVYSSGAALSTGSITVDQVSRLSYDGTRWNMVGGGGSGYTDEQAQDAIGAMIDGSLTYVDGTPLLQRSALTGDVTATAGSNATTIANDAVTYAKIQNLTDARLLGRSAGSAGDAQEITVGAGLSLSAGALTATGTTYTFTNLLTESGGTVKLGGTATETTTLAMGAFPLLITSSVSTGLGPTAGMQLSGNSLTTGNLLDVGTTSMTSGVAIKAASTSTAINHTAGTNSVGWFETSGANANVARTAIALSGVSTNTNATSGTNIGGFFKASGATTANYAAYFEVGSSAGANAIFAHSSGLATGSLRVINGQRIDYYNNVGRLGYLTTVNPSGGATDINLTIESGNFFIFNQSNGVGNVVIGGQTITASTKLDVRGIGNLTANIIRLANLSNVERMTVLDDGQATFLSSTSYIRFSNTTNPTLTFTKSGVGSSSLVYDGNITWSLTSGGYGLIVKRTEGEELFRIGGGGVTGAENNAGKIAGYYLKTNTGSTAGSLSAEDSYGHFALLNVGARFYSSGSNRIAAGIWFENSGSQGLYIHNALTDGGYILNHNNHYLSLGYGTGTGGTLTGSSTHSMIRVIKKVDNLGGFDHTGAFIELINSGPTGNFITTHNGSGTTYFSVASTGLATTIGGLNLSGASSPLQVGGSAGTSGQVLTSAGAGATPTWGNPVANLTVGTSTIASGTTGRFFYNNAGVLGETSVMTWTDAGDIVTIGTSMTLNHISTSYFIAGGNTTASGALENSGFGYQSLLALSSGDNNTAIGGSAGIAISTGSGNTVLGRNAGASVSTTSNNTFVGVSSGINVTGSNNTFVGASTETNASSGSNNILLGYNIGLQNTSSSDQLSIQNIIFGSGNSGTGITASTGEISIGVAPSTGVKFQVHQSAVGSEVMRHTSAATNTDPIIQMFQNRVATTNATVTTLHTFGTTSNFDFSITCHVTARRTGGVAGAAGDGAGYVISATFTNVAGTVTQIGSTSITHSAESQAGWNCGFTISGTNILLEVTGATDNNITWHLTKGEISGLTD